MASGGTELWFGGRLLVGAVKGISPGVVGWGGECAYHIMEVLG